MCPPWRSDLVEVAVLTPPLDLVHVERQLPGALPWQCDRNQIEAVTPSCGVPELHRSCPRLCRPFSHGDGPGKAPREGNEEWPSLADNRRCELSPRRRASACHVEG